MSGNDLPTILFLSHRARHLGGAERSLIDILHNIESRGIVHLVTSEDGILLDRLGNSKIRVTVIPCSESVSEIRRDRLLQTLLMQWRALIAYFRFVLDVNRFVCRLKPACIHANVPKSHVTLMLLTVLGYRGAGIIHMREILSRRSVSLLLYRFLFRTSQIRIIAVSEAVKQELPEKLRQRALVIYNGVFLPETGDEFECTPPIRFLYLGRIVPWKGCHLIIEAFKRICFIKSVTATLDLTGETWYWDPVYRRELWNSIESNGLAGRVFLNGGTEDPYGAIQRCHVLCMASDREPFGRVAAEAQGCGRPVIGFASGGLPEIVHNLESGILVEQGDVEGLASAMAYFIDNPLRILEMGRNGRKRMKELFNGPRQIPKIVQYIIERSGEYHHR